MRDLTCKFMYFLPYNIVFLLKIKVLYTKTHAHCGKYVYINESLKSHAHFPPPSKGMLF